MINLYDDEGGQEELDEVRQALYNCYHTLSDAFEYYSVMSPGFLHSREVDLGEFNLFIDDCEICDSKTCTKDDVQFIFEFENAEENSNSADYDWSSPSNTNDSKEIIDNSELNDVNNDSALMRFEFLGCVARLAVVKYVKTNIVNDVSEAIQMLCDNHISKFLGPKAICDSNDFRKDRLYNPHVDKIYRDHLPRLLSIFEHFSSPKGTGQLRMYMSEWGQFVTKAGLIADDFEEIEAKLAYSWSQMAHSSEVNNRTHYLSLSFEDFLEGIGRICDLKALPTTAELRVAGTKNTGLFFQKLEEEGSLPDFYESHPNEWNEEKTRPLADLLPKLLELI